MNLVFACIELIGGLYVNSFAILSDALHDLGDSVSLGIGWVFQKISKRKTDSLFTYGYRRFSILGALINAVILVIGSGFVVYHAVQAFSEDHAPNAEGMLVLSLVGVLFNIAAWLRLRKGTSINEKVVSLHLLEDVLGWVAVFIGSIAMMIWGIPFLDPLLSILISIFILINAVRSLKKSFQIFLQATPGSIDTLEICELVRSVEGVDDVHDCHIWSMDGEFNVLTIHLICKKNIDLLEQNQIKEKVKEKLSPFPVEHFTFEFELADKLKPENFVH